MARAHHYLLEHRVFRRYLRELAPSLEEGDTERAAFLAGFSASVAKVVDYVLADADALAAFEADQIVVIDLLDPIRGRRQAERARAHPLFERLGAAVFGPLFECFDDAPAVTFGADAAAARAAWTEILEAAAAQSGGAGVGVLLRWAPGARPAPAGPRAVSEGPRVRPAAAAAVDAAADVEASDPGLLAGAQREGPGALLVSETAAPALEADAPEPATDASGGETEGVGAAAAEIGVGEQAGIENAKAESAAQESAKQESAAQESTASATAGADAPEGAPEGAPGDAAAAPAPPPARRAPQGPSLISALRARGARAETSAAAPQRKFSRILPRAETAPPPPERPIPLAPKRPARPDAQAEAPLRLESDAALSPPGDTAVPNPSASPAGPEAGPTARAGADEAALGEATAADPTVPDSAAPDLAAPDPAALDLAAPGSASLDLAARGAALPEAEPVPASAPEAPTPIAREADPSARERPSGDAVRRAAPADELELVFWNIGDGSPQLFVEVAHKLLSERAPSMDAYFEMLTALALGETTRRAAIEALAGAAAEEAVAQETGQWAPQESPQGAPQEGGPLGEPDRTAPRWRVFWL